ncbi:hypothetical protein [Priestia megaterium]|uniref:hypothetical protein n=1 Tax=Priestia megaterium TaxID=1404 RepID=UPI000BFD482B|nr:hypothetical protein [Priestia megaterium]PGO60632.1 hypothetical protein CN981_08770 [Priestia megaterium]
MIWGYTKVDGWFFTTKWNYYQKRVGMASSYVERMIGFYRVHVTYSGVLSICDIEYRTEDFGEAFKKAEELLEKYKNAKDKSELQADYYSPFNPEGYWQTEYKNN